MSKLPNCLVLYGFPLQFKRLILNFKESSLKIGFELLREKASEEFVE